MKKLLILATVSFGLLTACSSNTDKEAGSTSDTTQVMAVDTTSANAFADSTKAAAEKAAKDSADAAHGHSH